MKTRTLQPGFMAGEVSPKLLMRSELKGLKYSAKKMLNWDASLEGPAITRRGFQTFSSRASGSPSTSSKVGFFTVYDSSSGAYNYLVEVYPTGFRMFRYIEYTSTTIASAPYWKEFEITLGTALNSWAFTDAVTLIQPPGLNELWIFFESDEAPKRIYYTGSTWTMADIVFTSPPTDWNATGNTNKYVSTACFFQGRLYVASAGLYGYKFWASRTNNYTNFNLGTSLPSHAMEYELSEPDAIVWIVGLDSLVLGTTSAEYIITSQEGVIMPGDVQVKRQSTYGSYTNRIAIGAGKIFFIDSSRKKIRSMQYEWTKEAWTAKDLLFGSDHLLDTAFLYKLGYSEYTQRLMVLLSDYTLISGTYNPESEIMAWTPYLMPEIATDGNYGFIYDIYAGSSSYREADFGISMIRYNDSYGYFNNLQVSFQGITEHNNSYGSYQDSKNYSLDHAVVSLNPDYLPKLTEIVANSLYDVTGVVAIIDGVYYSGLSFVGNTLTLPVAGWAIMVGLPYSAELETLTIQELTNLNTADEFVMKRWARLWLRFIEGYPATVNDREPASYEREDVDLQFSTLGYNRQTIIRVTQATGRRTILVGIYGQVAKGDL